MINLLIGMVRSKFAAVLIGPIGVGLLGNFIAIQQLISTIVGLGIGSSAVRDVAEAVTHNDEQVIGRTILTLRRICWLTGLLGMSTMLGLSPFLSRWTFGNDKYTLDISLLSISIFLGNLSSGQSALIQGMRRINDLARINVIGAIAGTSITIGFYTLLGLRGIVPALVLMSLVQLIINWFYARRVTVPVVAMSWIESFQAAGGMLRLGLVFMWTGLMVSGVAYVTRILITQISLEGVGIFIAAFSLSGMFANFVLSAMGADYYPRLTAEAADHTAMNRMVNEQSEIAILLSLPGLLTTLCLAPWIIRFFYTVDFLPAVALLQWFILGCLGRIVSWPLGFVMLALAKGRLYFLVETIFNVLHLVLICVGLLLFGIEGVAMAFFALYLCYAVVVYGVAQQLTGFRWSQGCQRLLILLLSIAGISFIAARLLPLWPATIFGIISTVIVSVLCLRGLVNRIGSGHRIVRKACRLPGVRLLCGL